MDATGPPASLPERAADANRFETFSRICLSSVQKVLAMEKNTEKCAHPSCECPAQPDSDYCSTYCEGQGETPDILCGCGHGGCAEALPVEDEMRTVDYAR